MDSSRPLDLVLLRRGFDLDDREVPAETGRRSIVLPPDGEKEVSVVFCLRAAQEGEGEVQVVVRQDNPLPLATLRLTATVLQRSTAPTNRAAAEAAPAERTPPERATTPRGVTPFVNPQSLVIDENLVGETSELSFDLALPRYRRRFTHVVRDKAAVLRNLFDQLDAAWHRIPLIADPLARSRAFQDN